MTTTNKIVNIQILDGWQEKKTIKAKFLGKGAFAKCYKSEEDGLVYSFVASGQNESDYSKQAIAEFTDQNNPYIPKIEQLGEFDDNGGILYRMPFYQPLTKQSGWAWSEFQLLKQAINCLYPDKTYGYDRNSAIIEYLRQKGQVSSDLVSALEDINTACSNYSLDYLFEFCQRNLKVDDNGHLILLDCIFNRDALKEKRNQIRFIRIHSSASASEIRKILA